MISHVIVKDAGNKGKGVFAIRDFTKGEFIFRRRHGRVIANRDLSLLSEEDQRHLCELDWNTCAILLPPGCYLNHSCDPNALRKGVNVYAWKDIRQGDEVTIDYRLNAFTGQLCDCFCESENCQGYFILSFFSLPEEQQRMYLPFTPKFIQKEYYRQQNTG
jgi:histone-lysine N-methyltransferase SETD2